MKAAVLRSFDGPLSIAEVDPPRIEGANDVIVRIAGAGLCGSDVHLIEGAFKDVLGVPKFPYVLGHENAGFVESVGSGVTTVRVGDPVLVHPHISCGLCRACRRGDESFCEALQFPGIDGSRAGGFAELLGTTERALVRLPVGTDPAPLASLADAGLTAYHAVRRAASSLAPDGTAVVIGLGGVGVFALQLLRLFSPAHLFAVDVSDKKLAEAHRLGADIALPAGGDLVERIMTKTGGVGVDLVLDCVGVPPVPSQSLAMLRRGGVYSVLGADKGEACCGTLGLTGRELTIRGNLVGTLGELGELAELVLRGRVQLVQQNYALHDASKAVDDLRSGRVQGRAVLVP